ncbi:MAG: helix-turn-helix domain-containing protein [Oscillospiraceae bacterium]|nr:helix-turn-helix domain-containing protein [Oscillospiraceae bacterium]MBR6207498.1 helix-turn-helix domain-containing protein [Oscillospiraceae bacterium]
MLSLEAFGERVRKLRTKRNLTQQELADLLFVSRKTIGNWETGGRLPDISTLASLARHLGVQTYELLDEMYIDEGDSPIVIVVEKERLILNSFVQLIRSALPEVQVFGFDSFSEVHRFASVNQISVAFIDVELHEASGFVLAKLLQSISPRINIVFLTRDFNNTDAAWEIYPSGCVLMPLTREKIRAEIEHLRFPIRGLGA